MNKNNKKDKNISDEKTSMETLLNSLDFNAQEVNMTMSDDSRAKKATLKNLHEGHRKRLKEKYINFGLDSFSDHEILELMLFYAIPMKDTNKLAHKMINEFGSLYNLFDAFPLDIANRCNVTENTAVLISLIPCVYKRYATSKWEKRFAMDTSKKAGHFLVSLFADKTDECFYIICLDAQRKLIFPALVSQGTINETPIYPRQIVETALKYKAASIILSHNHPSGSITPSQNDIDSTRIIINTLKPIGIDVVDHIIVGGGQYFSFSEKRKLNLEY